MFQLSKSFLLGIYYPESFKQAFGIWEPFTHPRNINMRFTLAIAEHISPCSDSGIVGLWIADIATVAEP